MATNFFGIGYHFKIFRSQVATEKKKLILCPERVFLGLHAVKCNITKLTIKNKEKLAFIGQSAVLGC